ncbi:MAG: OmpH family outer membrane protein [Planctomycetota bacterium]|jgi:hypothetical protein
MRVSAVLAVVFGLAFLLSPALAAKEKGKGKDKEKKKPKVEINEAEIYLGDPKSFKKPAVVDVDKVYAEIPEYKEIRDRKMDSSNPRYLFLMRAASDKFRAALEAVSKKHGYDLIGGLGSIKIEGKKVPDVTQKVIAKLPKKK